MRKDHGVRLVVPEEDEEAPWTAPPSRRRKDAPIPGPLPERLELVLADQIYIAKENLPAPLRNALIRLAAFQNPEFYKAQPMRLPTYDKPRIIACAEQMAHRQANARSDFEAVVAEIRPGRHLPRVQVGGDSLHQQLQVARGYGIVGEQR